MSDAAAPLVKWHGVSYGGDGDLPVSSLMREFRYRFERDDDWPVVRVLRLTRNVFYSRYINYMLHSISLLAASKTSY